MRPIAAAIPFPAFPVAGRMRAMIPPAHNLHISTATKQRKVPTGKQHLSVVYPCTYIHTFNGTELPKAQRLNRPQRQNHEYPQRYDSAEHRAFDDVRLQPPRRPQRSASLLIGVFHRLANRHPLSAFRKPVRTAAARPSYHPVSWKTSCRR